MAFPVHPNGIYLQPGWYYPATRSAGNSPQYLTSSLPAPAGIFIPSPPSNPVGLPPSPGVHPVYPPAEPRVRRHSFDASHLYPGPAPWPYPPASPYSWNWHSPPLPTPSIHHLLDGAVAGEHLSADLSAYHLSLRSRGRSLQYYDRETAATHPGIVRVRIVCDLIPQWPIDITLVGTTITPSRPDRAAVGVITVEDVLYAIHSVLHKQITHEEWAKLTPVQEIEVSRAYTRRYKAYPPVESELRRAGVKRIDFLGKRVFFRGLTWLTPEAGLERLRLIVDSRDNS